MMANMPTPGNSEGFHALNIVQISTGERSSSLRPARFAQDCSIRKLLLANGASQRERLRSSIKIITCVTYRAGTKKVGMYQVAPRS